MGKQAALQLPRALWEGALAAPASAAFCEMPRIPLVAGPGAAQLCLMAF